MAHLFYDHLVAWDRIHDALDRLALDGQDRLELTEHMEHSLHTSILIVIVETLPVQHHEEFIDLFAKAPHDPSHIDYLARHGRPDIEDHLRISTAKLIDELLSELLEPEE